MIKSLRKDTLIRKINTYHCTINDKWYNGEGTFGIFCEAYEDVCKRTDLSIEEFLPYLQLYTNKNRNYCLNFIFYEYIEPLLNNIKGYYEPRILRSFNLKHLEDTVLTYEEADRKYQLGSGYCCEDCDGDYTQYKKNRYHYNYEIYNIKKAAKLFIDELNSLKTGRSQLAPIQLAY